MDSRLFPPARAAGSSGRDRVFRLEPLLLVLFLACWLVILLSLVGVVHLAGRLELALYPLYILGALLGWLAGNVYVQRSKSQPRSNRRRLLITYLLGPPGWLYLLRAMAPAEVQSAAPLVPIFSFAVFAIFFFVPVTLRDSFTPRRKLEVGKRPPGRD